MAHGAQGIAQLLLSWPDQEAIDCVSDQAAFGDLMEWPVPHPVRMRASM